METIESFLGRGSLGPRKETSTYLLTPSSEAPFLKCNVFADITHDISDGSEGSNFDPTLAIHGYGIYLDCIVIVCTVYMTSKEHGTFVAVYSIVPHLDKVKTDEVSDTPE